MRPRTDPLSVWREGALTAVDVHLAASPTTVATAEEYENETFGLKARALTDRPVKMIVPFAAGAAGTESARCNGMTLRSFRSAATITHQ